jgi:transcriptional repressor NrdR
MRCPFCLHLDSKVLDSRQTEEGASIRRRRECTSCQKRFTTYERVEELPFLVIKRDGGREAFSRTKILNGILRACEKRPISLDVIEKTVDEIERQIRSGPDREVASELIGELGMDKLRDVDNFIEEVQQLRQDK